jgi:hypothetical protein
MCLVEMFEWKDMAMLFIHVGLVVVWNLADNVDYFHKDFSHKLMLIVNC